MISEPYRLAIHPEAEREWARLDHSIRARFKQKLAKERLKQPRVAKDSPHGLPDCYKIKITKPQFRLTYHVDDARRVITLMAVSTRDDVYALLASRAATQRGK